MYIYIQHGHITVLSVHISVPVYESRSSDPPPSEVMLNLGSTSDDVSICPLHDQGLEAKAAW